MPGTKPRQDIRLVVGGLSLTFRHFQCLNASNGTFIYIKHISVFRKVILFSNLHVKFKRKVKGLCEINQKKWTGQNDHVRKVQCWS